MNKTNNQTTNFNQLPYTTQSEVVDTIVKYSNGDRAFARNIAKGGMSVEQFDAFITFVGKTYGKKGKVAVIKALAKVFDGKVYGKYSIKTKTQEEIAKEKRQKVLEAKKRKEQMSEEEKKALQKRQLNALELQEKKELRELRMLSPQERKNILMKKDEYQMSSIEFARFAQKHNDKRFKFSY